MILSKTLSMDSCRALCCNTMCRVLYCNTSMRDTDTVRMDDRSVNTRFSQSRVKFEQPRVRSCAQSLFVIYFNRFI
jgi:hypothetical protein